MGDCKIQERRPNLHPKVSDDPLGLQTHPDAAIFFGADNLPAKKSGSKKATETKPKTSRGKPGELVSWLSVSALLIPFIVDSFSGTPRRSGRIPSATGGALQKYETSNEAQQAKEDAMKKANVQPIPETTPLNPFAPSKEQPRRRRKKMVFLIILWALWLLWSLMTLCLAQWW
jgi:hypothetical protein